MKRRVLLIAYYFPPLGGIGSLRVTGHATYLPEFGWESVVLAPRTGAYHRDDAVRFPEDRVIRTGSLELSRVGKRVLGTGGDDVQPAEVRGLRRAMRSAARTGLYFPDAQVGWTPFAVRTGRRALRQQSVDAIFSSSFPITAHVIARRLARRAKLPWVAEFRDPWSEMLPPGRNRDRAARLERRLARDATAIVMTSPSWAAHHAELWERPVDVVPNGHDLDTRPPPKPSAGFVLGYLGTYYPLTQSSLSGVWDAIERLDEQGGPRVTAIRFVGDPHATLIAELRERGLEHRVETTGFVPNSEAIEHMRSCSVALLAGPRDANGILRGHVAGKTWEYLATGAPILYVGDPAADVATELRGFEGTHVAEAQDVDAIASALADSVGRRFVRDVSGCSKRARAAQLATILERTKVASR